MFRALVAVGVLCATLLTTGCGYHVAGHTNALPAQIRSIAVLPFANATTQYRIADRVTAAITREMIQRTKYQITSDANQADAFLNGSLVNFISYPSTYDVNTGRASGVFIIAIFTVSLTERATGKVLYKRPNFEIHERYEISVDPKTYFDENPMAVDRLSHDVAQTIVSAILEQF